MFKWEYRSEIVLNVNLHNLVKDKDCETLEKQIPALCYVHLEHTDSEMSIVIMGKIYYANSNQKETCRDNGRKGCLASTTGNAGQILTPPGDAPRKSAHAA